MKNRWLDRIKEEIEAILATGLEPEERRMWNRFKRWAENAETEYEVLYHNLSAGNIGQYVDVLPPAPDDLDD